MSITRHQSVGAYRPWQPQDFGQGDEAATSLPLPADADERSAAQPPQGETPPAAEEAPNGVALQLPTVEDIERIHEEARCAGWQEGFDAGRAAGHAEGFAQGSSEGWASGHETGRLAGHEEGRVEGYDEGHAAGYAAGAAAADEAAQRLRVLLATLEEAFASLQHEVADELLALAREIARRMVGEALSARPELIITTIQTALAQIPQGHAQIHLHPDDLLLVRQHVAEHVPQSAHRLIEDAEISRGGCRIETGALLIDATLETRWRRVLDSLDGPAADAPPPERHELAD